MDLFRRTIRTRRSYRHHPYRHLAIQYCAHSTHRGQVSRPCLHRSFGNLRRCPRHNRHRFHSTIRTIPGFGLNHYHHSLGTSSIRHYHHQGLHRSGRKRRLELRHHRPFHRHLCLDCSNPYVGHGIQPSRSIDHCPNQDLGILHRFHSHNCCRCHRGAPVGEA